MATALQNPARSTERNFYLGMALAMIAVIFAGFAPSFYLRGAVTPYAPMLPMTPLVILHGLLFTGWALLFVLQVSLVSAGRTDIHRRTGMIGIYLLAAMIAVGTLAALNGVARNSGPHVVSPLAWLAVPLFDVPMFATLIGSALYFRRTPQTHKRLMLIAMMGMLSPAIGRLPFPPFIPFPIIIFGSKALFLLPLIIWDLKSQGKVHVATIGGGAVLVGSWILRLAVWQTPAWLAFAGWAASLVA